MTYGDYLAHHGILGQKWGVRRYQNPDGTLTAAGKERYQKQVHEIISKSSYDEDVSDKVFKAVGADKKYLTLAKKVIKDDYDKQVEITKETNELFKDLRSDAKLHKYEAASELADWANYKHNNDVNNCTLDELGSIGFHAVLDDGQQSPINAYSMYTSEHGLMDKVVSLGRESFESSSKARTEAADLVIKAFKDVKLDDLTASPNNPNYTAGQAIALRMQNSTKRENDWKRTNGRYYLNDAVNAVDFSDAQKKNMKKSMEYVNKITNSHDESTWEYVAEAAEKLDMSSTKLKNLSQNDWNRLNKEIAKLRDEDF